jgi:hypothetical protein
MFLIKLCFGHALNAALWFSRLAYKHIHARCNQPIHSHVVTEIDDVLKSCLRRMKPTKMKPTSSIGQHQKLLEKGEKLNKDIATRIEQSWKIARTLKDEKL